MTKANGQYLITQFKTYYAVMQVPKDLHATFGKRKFIQTLETHNFAEAEIRKLPHVHRWKSLIKAATNFLCIYNLILFKINFLSFKF